MTRLVLWHIRKTYRKRSYFLGIDRKGMKAVMLIGFLSFPILSQINQLFGNICANFDFQDDFGCPQMIAIISRLYSCFRILDWPLWNWLAECLGRLQFVQVFWTQGFAVLQPGSGHCNEDYKLNNDNKTKWVFGYGKNCHCSYGMIISLPIALSTHSPTTNPYCFATTHVPMTRTIDL